MRREGLSSGGANPTTRRAGSSSSCDDVDDGTLIRVTESRPLACSTPTGRDLAIELGLPRRGMPEMLAGAGSLH